jgi:dihydroorotate dehydrogenase electron transfer subunit
MKWLAARITSQTPLRGMNRMLVLHAPAVAAAARPGQFIELSTEGATLLNKPLSIAGVDRGAGTLTLAYKIVGPGTRAFAEYQPGRVVQLLGPCGNGFPELGAPACLVGGGIGIPPLHFLASESTQPLLALLGARTADDIVLADAMANLPTTSVRLASDDGSIGHHGVVTDLLEESLRAERRTVVACGPLPMLAAVARTCRAHDVELFACLEAYMGCGIGICMGCVVPTTRGYERVCREGPVFRGEDILWDELLRHER